MYPCPSPWLDRIMARLDAEDADRREWIEQVRTRLGLVTIDGGPPRPPAWPALPAGHVPDLTFEADVSPDQS
jgi:hypothetical protein